MATSPEKLKAFTGILKHLRYIFLSSENGRERQKLTQQSEQLALYFLCVLCPQAIFSKVLKIKLVLLGSYVEYSVCTCLLSHTRIWLEEQLFLLY